MGHISATFLALAKMILGYIYVNGYQVDEERACMLGEVDPTPPGRMKPVMVASRMIDLDDCLIPASAVGYDPQESGETYMFITVLDFGNDVMNWLK